MSFFSRGTIQYMTSAEGDACNAWLDGWAAAHDSLIYQPPGLTNSHSLTVIDPPTVEGCVSQLTFEYHFNLPQSESQTLQAEIERAVTSDFGTASCDSTISAGID
jgi:hypothetical protein